MTKEYENLALLELRAEREKSPPSKQAGLIPLQDFFKNSLVQQMQISPDGKHLAFLKFYKKRYNIFIQKIGSPDSERRITNQTKRDIRQFFWKGNNNLIFMQDCDGDENDHIFCVFADGSGEEKDLTPLKNTKTFVIDDLDGLSKEHILMGANQRDKRVFDAYKLNIKTGEMKMMAQNPGHYTSWGTDHAGCLRWATSYKELEQALYYRESEKEDFQKIKSWSSKDGYFDPLFFTFDNQQLYACSNLDRDKTAIVIFDPKKKKTLSTLFSHLDVDIGELTYSKKRKVLLTAYYEKEKPGCYFFDPEFKKTVLDIESRILDQEISLFKTRRHWYSGSSYITGLNSNKEEDLMVVFSYSDRNPGVYWLYDTKSKNLQKISRCRPWIKEKQMVEMQPICYKSRDELDIHGYLSLPRPTSKEKPPLVVMPHGGPGARDCWGYHSDVQFLANRGYAVLQMNFRHSSGYGKTFFQAGFKQWGRKMQDDITDGVLYLIEQGLVDKNKVAIYGASYGGYAVLAGLAFTPDLYACGVDYVGISNLFTDLENLPPYWVKEPWYESIGHPEKDKELLKAISPIFHVDKIKAPLFVVQGAKDPRVKKQESDSIVSALEKRRVKVPYLLKENEGHGFLLEENQLDFYGLLEFFLKKHLKP